MVVKDGRQQAWGPFYRTRVKQSGGVGVILNEILQKELDAFSETG